MLRVLIIDNHDSFTWNLFHLVARVTGVRPDVVANDFPDFEALAGRGYSHVIVSPGPGHPGRARDFGISARVLEEWVRTPVLGVCLGHQGLACAAGARVVHAEEPVHGRTSAIRHSGEGLFAGLPQSFEAVRYHSLIVEGPLPEELEAVAWTGDGLVMALRHRTRPHWGVQFHPESILTEHGERLVANFFALPVLQVRRLEYGDPAVLFTAFAGKENAFWLDGERFSYMGSADEVADELPVVERRLPDTLLPFPFQGGWVGSIAFANTLGEARKRFLRVRAFVALDHVAREAWVVHEGAEPELALRDLESVEVGDAPRLEWAQSKGEYLRAIERAKELIRDGESYEVCLTNQLRGATKQDPLAYFLRVRERNRARHGAYLRFGDLHVACASPERFLRVSHDGLLEARPIKGTASADTDAGALARDAKARAEHLMIVDLLRNDLGRVSRPGSVEVPELFAIETHGNVHQMVSTITGQLRDGLSAMDAVDAAFPGGSMTGAPKERTLEIIAALETAPRGIYSGCIGYVSHTGAADFNIVIRTAVFENGEVSIGSGGAIVAMSDAEAEWEEIELKARRLVETFAGHLY